MFRFAKKIVFAGIIIFSSSVLNMNSLECISMKNQGCKTR